MRIPKFSTSTDPDDSALTIILIGGERFGPSYEDPLEAETVCNFLTDMDEEEWTRLLSSFSEARPPQP
jgi:hypothetical protein